MQIISRRRAGTALVTALASLAGLAPVGPANAADRAVWLCRPGLTDNPCTPSLSTTRVKTDGTVLGPITVTKDRRPKVDCFYVYPTVSNQAGLMATREVDPEERSIALYQASRYSQTCRVFAPMYRQITIQGLLNPSKITPAIRAQGYADVLAAWREYLRRDNHGRGVVLIGHSQGSFLLRKLIADVIDPRPASRAKLVSAVLLGGNVLVRKGKNVGGDFQRVRACRSERQLSCVIAFSTFNATPPDPSAFGRASTTLGTGSTAPAGLEVLCTNPVALGGGTGRVTPVFPSAPFAPGTAIGIETTLTGFPAPAVPTTYLQANKAFLAGCSRAGGADVLRLYGAGFLRALPDATWGLHLTDANIALGDLARLVAIQARHFTAAAR